jgi:hypothetical protein
MEKWGQLYFSSCSVGPYARNNFCSVGVYPRRNYAHKGLHYDQNDKIQNPKVKLSFDTPEVLNIPIRESSIFDDFRNFSKRQGLAISLPKQNLERTEGERIILRFAEARRFLR